MIQSLHIKNYALIEKLEMTPSPALNIITGETGAGKSIMLGAVGLLLGNRADTKVLYLESEKCVIEGVFSTHSNQVSSILKAEELDEGEACIIRREISPSGKSRAFVNDTPVTLDVLKSLGKHLMDIHSQHENLELGSNAYQLSVLDAYAGNVRELQVYQAAYRAYLQAMKDVEHLEKKSLELAEDTDYKQFLFSELNSAGLEGLDATELESELARYENAELIRNNLGHLTDLLSGLDSNLVDQLASGISLLSELKDFGGSYPQLHDRLQSSKIEIEDIADEIQRELGNVELDPERLQLLQNQTDMLNRLLQKHKARDVQDLIAIKAQIQGELKDASNVDEDLATARVKLKEAEVQTKKAGAVLTNKRINAKDKLALDIEGVIAQIGIENGTVKVATNKIHPSPTGLDEVEILFSANKGVAAQPLKAVASGGEFSRLIFAVKYLLADRTELPTIIFDEIDTGVSGQVALQMIGMMKKMAKKHQIVAISHLPQFAAGGDAHYFVYKDHSAERSVSKIKQLSHNERVTAIAAMIDGANPGPSALESARELLEKNSR